jgi:hypothetical protein
MDSLTPQHATAERFDREASSAMLGRNRELSGENEKDKYAF